MARQNLAEVGLNTQILEASKDGSILIQVMSPGWGSSGYYSTEVVEAAGKDKVWPKGTHMYLDHPSMSEAEDRPERSVKNLAATLSEDAYWDKGRGALVARMTPVGAGKPLLADKDFREAIACSVRASAEMNIGEAEGRSGWIIEKIYPSKQNSVDFVTHAGRGGMILESARQVSEATNNDRAQQLSDAVREKYGAAKTWVWTRDFDESRVWFEVNKDGEASQIYEQTYTVDDGDMSVTLTGTRTEVRVRTQYVPLKAAAESAGLELTREAALKQVREARNVGQWIESRLHLSLTQLADDMYGNGKLTRPERITLSSAVGDALASFTAAVEDGAPQLFQRDLWTDPEARAAVAETATPNVPVHPAGQSTTTKEHTMPEIEEGAKVTILETKLRTLEADAGRVPLLESERDTARTERDEARKDLAVEKAKNYAREIGATRVKEANSELEADVVEMIVVKAMSEALPIGEDGLLDTDAFGKRVDNTRTAEETYLAKVAAKRGGDVRGLGPVSETKEATREDSKRAIDEAWGRTPKQTQEA